MSLSRVKVWQACDVSVTGMPAAKIMHAVLPYMGERRACAIREVLRAWNPVQYKAATLFRQSLAEVI